MRQINLPLSIIDDDNEPIEIEVKTSGKSEFIRFRLESFLWEVKDKYPEGSEKKNITMVQIERLKKTIESYNKSWELIQIFAPLNNSKYIKVLYRKYVEHISTSTNNK